MKKTKLFGCFLVATMLGIGFSACTNEADKMLEQDSEIKLTSEITPSRVTSLDYQSNQIVKDQQIGITITGAKSEHKNVAWNVGEEGELSNTGDPVYFGNVTATITAYHPFNNAWDENTSYAFSVNTDQSSEENYRNSDMLWATATSSKTETAIPLIFSHKLAKINVTLVPEKSGNKLNGATISIYNTKTSTTFNPTTGVVSDATGEPQEIIAGVTADDVYTASAIVIPQEVSGKFIKITHEGKTYYYTLASAKTLAAGNSYSYTLTVKNKQLINTGSSINPWDDENSNEGDAEEEVIAIPNNQIWYTSSDGEIIIPNYCPEHSYKTFGANMLENIYENGKGIITFDNNVTKIGDASTQAQYAFYGCSTLTSITIPNSVTEIGINSFNGCTSLTSITIPKNVTQINGSFGNNSSLSNIVVEEGNSVYDSRDNCNAIIETTTNTLVLGCKNTIIPNSVTTIGTNSFSGCNSLTSITIPNGVTTIGLLAFSGCSSLESVEIPGSVTEIKMWAFGNCSSLKKANVKAIVPPQITSSTFPNNNGIDCYVPAESIDDYKAANYWKDLNILSEVTIPNNEIWYTSSNNSVVVPKIKNVFGANIVSNVYENGKGIITFDSDVTEIGEDAFQDCSYLTSITIPQSVTKIGSQIFAKCKRLTKITVDESNPIYDSRNNCNAIIETATNTLIQGCNNTIIPNTVTEIGQNAFFYCTTLTNITIPNSVTKIGSVAFQGCESLTSITIPNNVTEIGTGGIGCTSSTNINVDESNPVYDSRNNCNAIIETATNTLIQGCNNTIIPNTVTEIGETAFAASKITSITIPNSVTKIGLGAFFYCTYLSNITIPCSVTTIGEDAFSSCFTLSEVHVEAINPPKLLNNSVFYSEIKIYVPSESIDIYRATEYWKEFVLLAE